LNAAGCCGGQSKDVCGVCGGDGSTCISTYMPSPPTAAPYVTPAASSTSTPTVTSLPTTTTTAGISIEQPRETTQAGTTVEQPQETTTDSTIIESSPCDPLNDACDGSKKSTNGVTIAVPLVLILLIGFGAAYWLKQHAVENDYIYAGRRHVAYGMDNAAYSAPAGSGVDDGYLSIGSTVASGGVIYAVPVAEDDPFATLSGSGNDGVQRLPRVLLVSQFPADSRVLNNAIYQPSTPDVALTRNVLYAIPTEDDNVVYSGSSGNIVTLPSHAGYEGYTAINNALSPVYAIPTEDGNVVHSGSSGNIVTLPSHGAFEGYTSVETNDAGVVNAMNDEPASFRGRANTEC